MSGCILLSVGIILSSIVIAYFLLQIFKTPVQSLWSWLVIALCNYILLAAVCFLFAHFNFFIFYIVTFIGIVLFFIVTRSITQASVIISVKLVSIFVLIDLLVLVLANKLL